MEQVLLHKEDQGVLIKLSHDEGHYYASIGNGENTETIVVPDYFIKKDKGVFNLQWTEEEFSLWFDDQKLGQIPYPPTPTSSAGATYIGCTPDGDQWNGIVGPIKFSSEPNNNADYAKFPEITPTTTVIYRANIYPENAIISIVDIVGEFSGRMFKGVQRGKIQHPGETLQFPTSPLWAEMQTYGWALEDQAEQGELAEKQLYFHSSTGVWLDLWGDKYFGIRRFTGETDEAYAQRIVGELLRPNQNNVALENILKEAMGIDATIRDAWHYLEEIDPEEQANAPGHFFLDMSIPGEMDPEAAERYLEQARSVVRKNKSAGTDFLESALRKLVELVEEIGFAEAMAFMIEAAYEESFVPGPIRVGHGWRVGLPGLKVGINDPILEQIVVRTINAGNGSVAAENTYSGTGA